MMGRDDEFGTVDCLRGRLLAERMASKAAKAEAELMAKRLEELEMQLLVEIKCRNRAEKRLKHALKKLKSLKLLDFSGQLNLSKSSESLLSACFTGHHNSEGQKPDFQRAGSRQFGTGEGVEDMLGLLGLEEILGDDVLGNSSDDSLRRLVPQEGSWSSVETAHSHNKEETCWDETGKFLGGLGSQESNADSVRQSSISVDDLDCTKHQIECVDVSLALVPASLWPNLEACKPEINNTVQGVRGNQWAEELLFALPKSCIACEKD